jgi:hypothetical protein
MKNLFEPATVDEIKQRLAQLQPEVAPLWGKMNPAQAVAHCTAGIELALGDRRPPRMLIGRVLGPVIKRVAFVKKNPCAAIRQPYRDLSSMMNGISKWKGRD